MGGRSGVLLAAALPLAAQPGGKVAAQLCHWRHSRRHMAAKRRHNGGKVAASLPLAAKLAAWRHGGKAGGMAAQCGGKAWRHGGKAGGSFTTGGKKTFDGKKNLGRQGPDPEGFPSKLTPKPVEGLKS